MIVKAETVDGRSIEVHEERFGTRRYCYWAKVDGCALFERGRIRARTFTTAEAVWKAALEETPERGRDIPVTAKSDPEQQVVDYRAVDNDGTIQLTTLTELLDLLRTKTDYHAHVRVEVAVLPSSTFKIALLDNEHDAQETQPEPRRGAQLGGRDSREGNTRVTERSDAMRAVLTVRDLIQKLETLPPDLPVYLADWNEEWVEDWPLVEESIHTLPAETVRDRHGTVLFEQPLRLCLGTSAERATRRSAAHRRELELRAVAAAAAGAEDAE